ncbi:MAG: hypothetical protein WCS42_09610 [Verrucomicrobiota bacterium]
MKNIARCVPSMMRLGLPLALVATLFSVGCKKAKAPAAEAPAPTPAQAKQAETDHMPVYLPTPVAAPAVAAAPDAAPDLAELNRSMIRWLMKNHRKPKSFEDFAATAGVAIPPPPAGKKYIIAPNMHIQLVNR